MLEISFPMAFKWVSSNAGVACGGIIAVKLQSLLWYITSGCYSDKNSQIQNIHECNSRLGIPETISYVTGMEDYVLKPGQDCQDSTSISLQKFWAIKKIQCNFTWATDQNDITCV